MHDIWNPWHGCVKCSEGCEHCYMYFLVVFGNEMGLKFIKQKLDFIIRCRKIGMAATKSEAVS